MEADFARYYHLDFGDYHRGAMSLRRVKSLIYWLPPDAAVVRVEDEAEEKRKAAQAVADVEQALSPFQK